MGGQHFIDNDMWEAIGGHAGHLIKLIEMDSPLKTVNLYNGFREGEKSKLDFGWTEAKSACGWRRDFSYSCYLKSEFDKELQYLADLDATDPEIPWETFVRKSELKMKASEFTSLLDCVRCPYREKRI